jgi:hypothetical protein
MRKTQTTAKPQTTAESQTTTPMRRQLLAGKSAAKAAVAAAVRQHQPRSVRKAQPSIASPAKAELITSPRRLSKQATIEALVRRNQGAAILELMATTGWQSHSVRAALRGRSGAVA